MLTCIGHLADKRAARHRLPVELDVDGVRLRELGREVDEAAPAAQNLHVVRDLAVVDRDLQLALAGLGGVDAAIN